MSENGLITIDSQFSAAETLERLRAAILASGNTIFASIDHAAAAQEVGLVLQTTTVIAFGNPAAGTRLMQANQAIGIDLPLKMLVWEEASGKVKISYNDPQWLAARHGLGTTPVIAAMTNLLLSVAKKGAAEQAA